MLCKKRGSHFGRTVGFVQVLQLIQVHSDVFNAVTTLEAEFRNTQFERHLTAFKSWLGGIAGSGLRSFVPLGGSTTTARTFTAANTLGPVYTALGRGNFA
jgi:hypothetical protein